MLSQSHEEVQLFNNTHSAVTECVCVCGKRSCVDVQLGVSVPGGFDGNQIHSIRQCLCDLGWN